MDEISKKFKPKKNSSEKLSQSYARLGFNKKSANVHFCGTDLTFNKYKDDTVSLVSANFCKDTLCPMCAWRKSLKLFNQVYKCAQYLQPKYDFIFVTLTVKNCKAEDLKDILKLINKSYYTLTRRKDFKFIKGSFRGTEITYNADTNEFHPHIHAIWVVDKSYFKGSNYIKTEELVKQWGKVLNLDYKPICHIQKVKQKSKKNKNSLVSAVAESAKYCVKDSDYTSHSDNVNDFVVSTLSGALHNTRMFEFYGVFKKVRKMLNLTDVEKSNLINIEEEEKKVSEDVELVIIFKYDFETKNYYTYDCYAPPPDGGT